MLRREDKCFFKFEPFSHKDFIETGNIRYKEPSVKLNPKIEALRRELDNYPEFQLDFFRNRLARRPKMRGHNGLVFGPARWVERHWFLFDVGGDQNQIQLNIGMFPSHVRVGLGFMIGRQVSPKPPAFRVFQTFLGLRPPLPFRNALLEACSQWNLRLEIQGDIESCRSADHIVSRLETFHVQANDETVFVFLGKIWEPDEAATKTASDYREAFRHVMPFYEEINLASGAYYFHLE